MKVNQEAVESLIEAGHVVRGLDNSLHHTDQGRAHAEAGMGGSDKVHVVSALLRAVVTQGTIGSKPGKRLRARAAKHETYLLVLKAIQILAAETSEGEWRKIVAALETKYLEPIGYFEHRGRAFLDLGDEYV